MQVLNRLTHDRTVNKGGIKMGDFGTGGREYKSYSTRSNNIHNIQSKNTKNTKNTKNIRKIVGCVLFCISIVMLYRTEKQLWANYIVYDEIIDNAYGGDIIDSKSPLIPLNANLFVDRLVAFSSTELTVAKNKKILIDNFFEKQFYQTPVMKRVTEYCQWIEIPHAHTKKIGQKPNYCGNKFTSGEECGNVDCSRLSLSSCEQNSCCNIKQGDDILETTTSYTYHKGWRPTLINSLVFDNPVAYHNPQRNPISSNTYWTTNDIQLNKNINIKPYLIENVLSTWKVSYITKKNNDDIGTNALNSGFFSSDHRYYYSLQKDVNNNSNLKDLIKLGASYLIDGVVDVSALADKSVCSYNIYLYLTYIYI